ncbi:MAG: hypothetical protein ACI9VR_000343 [Cognaticolwellia sp.]|jgi:hypothetical protein
MRILLVFHGTPPNTPGHADSGGAIRAWAHKSALESAGHQVLPLTRAQDRVAGGPDTFEGGAQLRAKAKAAAPDRILCVQPEEARHLKGIAPLCVDLYAPRLLEAQWQGQQSAAAVDTLSALDAADFVLFSNPRQRWFNLSLMLLAGMDPSLCAVVGLQPPVGPKGKLSRSPEILMGGAAWPWLDPVDGLKRAVAHLAKRRKGKVVVIGGQPALGGVGVMALESAVPAGPRLRYEPQPLSYGALLERYASGWAALDHMAPSPERELALAFRHVDYLGCGLPMITTAIHPLSDRIHQAQAGWVGPDIEGALDQVLNGGKALSNRSKAARALAESMRDPAPRALLDWVDQGQVRPPSPPALEGAAQLAARAQVLAARERTLKQSLQSSQAEVLEKRQEVEVLHLDLRQASASIAGLARAMEEVAGFKREAISVLGAHHSGAAQERDSLDRQLAETQADLAKKNAELRAMQREQDRLKAQLLESELRAQEAEGRAGGLGAQLDQALKRLRA